MLVWLAAGAAGAPSAWAGTYEVVSCGAPGAGGINRAWRPEAGGFDSADPPVHVPPAPASYEIIDQCPSQLLVRSSSTQSGNAPFLTGGSWIFDAPAGARLTRLETWRFGVKLRTAANDPEPSQDGDQGDPWKIFARGDGAAIIGGVFGETCTTMPGDIGCTFGSDTGVGAASHANYGINAGRISYTVSCEELRGCPHNYQNTPIASIKLFGTRVTVSDTSPPSLKAGGPLLSAGWRRPRDVLTYDAADNVGVRAVRLDIGGQTRRAAAPCDYRFRRTLVKARYRFQARLVAQPGYPYRGATSRRVSVLVRP